MPNNGGPKISQNRRVRRKKRRLSIEDMWLKIKASKRHLKMSQIEILEIGSLSVAFIQLFLYKYYNIKRSSNEQSAQTR